MAFARLAAHVAGEKLELALVPEGTKTEARVRAKLTCLFVAHV
jgi:hypothetical protein